MAGVQAIPPDPFVNQTTLKDKPWQVYRHQAGLLLTELGGWGSGVHVDGDP